MSINYKPLWKLLIDREISKTQMRIQAGISTRALAKLGRNEDVSTDVLRKICTALNCPLTDIVEVTPDMEKNAQETERPV